MLKNTSCLYLPHADNTLFGKAEKLFRFLSYNIWHRKIKQFYRGHNASKLRILDIGCGPGYLLNCIEHWFPNVEIIGVDQNEDLLSIVKSRCNNAIVFKGDACALPLQDQHVDIVFALHVAEHLPHPFQLFEEAYRVIRPNGLLILATPSAKGLGARVMKKMWRGYSDPTHISLHEPQYWRNLLVKAGFEISSQGTTGLSGIPFFNKFPLGLIHWIPLFFFGYFPWEMGEAYICVAIRHIKEPVNVNEIAEGLVGSWQ
jgi:ubiquinone/menaquinone biosynthesis C-methylase UbiE